MVGTPAHPDPRFAFQKCTWKPHTRETSSTNLFTWEFLLAVPPQKSIVEDNGCFPGCGQLAHWDGTLLLRQLAMWLAPPVELVVHILLKLKLIVRLAMCGKKLGNTSIYVVVS